MAEYYITYKDIIIEHRNHISNNINITEKKLNALFNKLDDNDYIQIRKNLSKCQKIEKEGSRVLLKENIKEYIKYLCECKCVICCASIRIFFKPLINFLEKKIGHPIKIINYDPHIQNIKEKFFKKCYEINCGNRYYINLKIDNILNRNGFNDRYFILYEHNDLTLNNIKNICTINKKNIKDLLEGTYFDKILISKMDNFKNKINLIENKIVFFEKKNEEIKKNLNGENIILHEKIQSLEFRHEELKKQINELKSLEQILLANNYLEKIKMEIEQYKSIDNEVNKNDENINKLCAIKNKYEEKIKFINIFLDNGEDYNEYLI